MAELIELADKTLKNSETNPIQIDPIDNEDGIGLAFSERYKDSLRYVSQWHKWLEWNGCVWEKDQKLSVFNNVRTLCRELAGREKKIRDRMLNTSTVSAIERLVRSDPIHAALPDQWDTDDYLLNTPFGIVDLSNGAILPHDPDKHCTKITSAGPAGECPTWDRFLNEITGGDTELIEFIQRVIGYACTGSIKEHALFFFYGTGANGKGTLLNTITSILKDYAVTAPMDVFTESKHDRHPTELAALMGARLVVAQETDEGRKWAEAKLKTLTGGDPISARFMRQDFFTFMPKFTLIIAGNHKPRIQTTDEAMRRRLHLVPFKFTIPKEQRDPDLPEKLCRESSGIMRWMIDGVIQYNEIGLSPPRSVIDATDGYFEDEDTLKQWIADKCETGDECWEPPKILFNSWREYASDSNLQCGDNRGFKSKLEAAGYRYWRSGPRGRHYEGIMLKPSCDAIVTKVTPTPIS